MNAPSHQIALWLKREMEEIEERIQGLQEAIEQLESSRNLMQCMYAKATAERAGMLEWMKQHLTEEELQEFGEIPF